MKDMVGKLSVREESLCDLIVNSIDTFIKQNGEIDRSELIAAYSYLGRLFFTVMTPLKDVDAQCTEIDSFCEFLKGVARKAIT